MVRVRLEGINTVRKRLADGSVKIYHYHRASGLRLDGEPGSAAFIASWPSGRCFWTPSRASACAGAVRPCRRHDWAAEKRAALDAWAAHVLAIVEGRTPAGNVVTMARVG